MTRPIPMNLLFDSADPDRELSDHERGLAERLSTEDLAAIDEALLQRAGQHWRKVAALVASALEKMEDRLPDLPDVYYAQRVRQLVQAGVLESQGDLARMRFSEVRLAAR